jgi:hypothetical protein
MADVDNGMAAAAEGHNEDAHGANGAPGGVAGGGGGGVIPPPVAVGVAGIRLNRAAVNVNAGAAIRDPLINVRDRLFHTVFYRLTLTYARACPRSMRRLIETIILIKVLKEKGGFIFALHCAL